MKHRRIRFPFPAPLGPQAAPQTRDGLLDSFPRRTPRAVEEERRTLLSRC